MCASLTFFNRLFCLFVCLYGCFSIRIYFIRVSRLKFAKFKNISKMNLRIRTHTFRAEDKVHAILLLPVISRQQTVFLSDLRFFFQWGDGSINLWLRRCAVSGMFNRVFSCRAYFSLRRNRPLPPPPDVCCLFKQPKRQEKFSFRFICFILGFKNSYSQYSFVTQIVI